MRTPATPARASHKPVSELLIEKAAAPAAKTPTIDTTPAVKPAKNAKRPVNLPSRNVLRRSALAWLLTRPAHTPQKPANRPGMNRKNARPTRKLLAWARSTSELIDRPKPILSATYQATV